MKSKPFTEEEMQQLRENPYTHRVTSRQLSFTAEFKARFWEDYGKGITPREIMRKYGYDPELLGEARINGIRMHIREEAKREDGFFSGRRPVELKAQDRAESADRSDKLARLEHEVKYLRQEVEFLKKISSIRIIGKQAKS